MKTIYIVLVAILLLASAGCSDNPTGAGQIQENKGTITIMMYDSVETTLQFDTLEYQKCNNTLIIHDNGQIQIYPSFNSKILKFYARE